MLGVRKVILRAAVLLGAGAWAALAQDLREGGVVFPAEIAAAKQIVWLPDGERLAVMHDDGKVEIREARDGRVTSAFGGGNPKTKQMWLSPDGRFMALWSDDWMLRLWDVAAGRLVAELQKIDSFFMPAFSADGRFLAVLQGRSQVVVLSLTEDGRIIARLDSPGQFKTGVFSPDNRSLATSEFGEGENGPDLLRIWSFEEARERVQVPFEHWRLRTMTYVPGGAEIAVNIGGQEQNPERTIVILDAESGAIRKELDVPGRAWGIPQFNRDGSKALINVFEGGPTLWRVPGWELDARLGVPAYLDEANSSAEFAGGGPAIMLQTDNDGLRFFAGRERIEILHRGPNVGTSRMHQVRISPSGEWLAVLPEEGPPEVWPLARVNALARAVDTGDVNKILAEADDRDKAGNTQGAEDVWGLITERFPDTSAAAIARAKLESKKEAFRAAIEASAEKQAREDEATLSAYTGGSLDKGGWMMGCLEGTNIELDVPEEELRPACGCMFDEMKKRLSPEHFLNLYFGMSAASNKLVAAATRRIIQKERGLGTYVGALQSATEEVKKACPFTWGH